MVAPPVTPYGAWPSPVTPERVTAGTVGLEVPQLSGDATYWAEGRPDQAGRVSLWRRTAAGTTELTPSPMNVRSGVHEYGGGAWTVADGTVAWASFPDGDVWLRVGDAAPRRIVHPGPRFRYADLRLHAERLLAVREDHGDRDHPRTEPEHTVVSLSLAGDNADGGTVLCRGADFYASPELSADGRLAWVEWDHPNMPWDDTRLAVAPLGGASLGPAEVVAGGSAESVVHPRWLPDGGLLFCSDRTDWWNLYHWDGGETRAVHAVAAELAGPQWVLGQQPYAVIDADRVLCRWGDADGDRLRLVDVRSGAVTVVPAPGDGYRGLAAEGERVAVLATSVAAPSVIAETRLGGHPWLPVRVASEDQLPTELVSAPQAVSWPGRAGQVHGHYYPPVNPAVTPPADELPPMIVTIHGGPTSAASTAFDLEVQYWSTRGFAVLDVDYSGSTGYGRAYRQRLRGRWGELDVSDCADGARAMAEQGRADPGRLAIMGGSAGGYTVLRALTWTEDFAAGVSLYGVGDLAALATDTHKFESRYLDGLVGPYPAEAATYADRSPLQHVDDLSSPILLLQGLEDKVVPPDQAETFAAAARAKGLPVGLVVFPDEGHGFRKAANIKATLEATLYFLGRVFGFAPADDLPGIAIDNLPQSGQ